MRAVLAIVGALFYAWVLIQSLPTAAARFGGGYWEAVLWIVLAIFAVLAAAAAVRRLGTRTFLVAIAAAGLGVRIAWVLWIDTPPVSDFKDMLDAAIRGAAGDFSFAGNEYFGRWAYLMGFTLYETVVVKLVGPSVLVLKLLNAAFSAATALVVYRIGRSVFGETTGRIAAVLYAFYIPNVLMCSVLTNQHLSTLLFALGCWLLVFGRLRTRYGWLWIGLLFVAGQIIRPLGGFYAAGAVVYGLVVLLRRPGPISRRAILLRLAGLAAVYLIGMQLVSQALIGAGFARYPLAAQEPYWKFMVGMNVQTTGGWSQEDTDYALSYRLGSERDAAERTLLLERLRTVDVPALLWAKAKLLWGGEDASAYWSLFQTPQADLQAPYIRAERVLYAAMAAFGVVGMLALWRRREEDEQGEMLLAMLLLGYAVIHLVIEIQTRYRLDMMPAFILLLSYGVRTTAVRCGRWKNQLFDWRRFSWKKSKSL
ncbi:glycosyltransferase family 39 protein [Cohnella sp. REN36]|uniref:ArnT family glycosyltransferase n=1 Tax=Cohnella sp. REN36 TaxID=2887347 RepID=UPI001D155B59|nr:glycosyltransferase family 39 protein [Cohnella sp. REN36]MCC3371596.1 glycosyltransferase family 39 protein [Cohnella sp. REN36]